jgi:hypothetical protein
MKTENKFLRPLILLILVLSFLIMVVNLNFLSSPKSENNNGTLHVKTDEYYLKRIESLWDNTIRLYLLDPLWIDRDIYDACHYLMVPLHSAFYLDNEEWKKQFSEHFHHFVEIYPDTVSEGRLNRLHYFYLASRFLVLSIQNEREELIPPGLTDIVVKEVKRLWEDEPAWQWGQDPFVGGMKARIHWKLGVNPDDLPRKFYRSIIDEELFLFAISADLFLFYSFKGSDPPSFLNRILETNFRVFKERVVWQEEGWLFQPGFFSDHPDYSYAGHNEKKFDMKPIPVDEIALDSSHSQRFPLFLKSFAEAYPKETGQKQYFEKLIKGLEKQLLKNILVSPSEEFPSWRLTNFMDGRNGVYRWGYKTLGEGRGYSPYQLSGSLLLGWWSFLASTKISEVYLDMVNRFPLTEEEQNLYTGPITTRERHPLVVKTDTFVNGMVELIVLLAYKNSYFLSHLKSKH